MSFFFAVILLLSIRVYAQPCNPFVFPNLFGQAETAIFCKNNKIGFGVSNSERGQAYTFDLYANNGQLLSRKGGPLDGNGGQLSVAAFMRSAKDVGEYRVAVTNPCGESGSVNFYAYYGNIDNLSITGWGNNSVSFKWAACGPVSDVRYEYAVTTIADPSSVNFSDYQLATDTSGYMNGLTTGQTYYIHVRVREVWRNGNSSNLVSLYSYPSPNSCSDLPYQTLRFIACSGAPPVGEITPVTSIVCTSNQAELTASGGTSYQWYDGNNVIIPGASLSTYMATAPGQYRVYVTTAAGCAGIAYTATVIDTVRRGAVLFGGGAYCTGDSVKLGLKETRTGHIYTLMQDNQDIITFPGIGDADEQGSPDTIWYKFKLTSAAQTGVYSVRSTDPLCGGLYFGYSEVSIFNGPVTGLNAFYIADAMVAFNWDPQGSGGSTSYEWAFTYDPSPPVSASGTINFRPVYFAPFTPGTQYYFHLRPACTQQPNPFSWSTIEFTTPNCSSAQAITLNTTVNAAMPTGSGIWNFSGTYPVNSTGYPTPGKELIYTFTPSETAVYYLDVTSTSNGDWIDYFYKPLNDGCSNTGWTAIDDMSGPGKTPIGLLTAGTTYFILLDREETTGSVTHSFQIRKATVGTVTPGVCTEVLYLSLEIPANSPKEEYLIDNNGNLIASLDFSNANNGVGWINASYYLNNGPVRRDIGHREYLDRNFSIRTTLLSFDTVGVKLFFTNADLQRLINEPNDGIADVSAISDINVSRVQQICSDSLYQGESSLLQQVSNGLYDATSSYIKFKTPGFSTFYLHGGVQALETNNNIICPAIASTSFTITSPGAGYTHRWQVDNGTGFQNLSNSGIYSGVTNTSLTLTNPPTSLNGYKYRCVSINGSNTVTSGGRTLKFIVSWTGNNNTQWQNAANWSCGVVPDANTDVIIENTGFSPVVSSNVSCRSIYLKSGTTLTVNPAFKLTITK